MVGTLVISLPADGEGGELVVSHQDSEETVDLAIREPGELAFAAFYADCLHRTVPVRSGHRVSLVYNLLVRQGSQGIPTRAPDLSSETAKAARILAGWASGEEEPNKIAWILDHRYSESGLDIEALKGRDAVNCGILADAALASDCTCHLALLGIEEFGTPRLAYGYGWYDDYEPDPADVRIEEIDDRSCTLTGWVPPFGREQTPEGELPLLDGEALPAGTLDDAEPTEQTLHEATGNGGASIERSYRFATFVIWPRDRFVSVLEDGPLTNLIDHAIAIFNQDRDAGMQLVSRVFESWREESRMLDRYSTATAKVMRRMLEMLAIVGDQELSFTFLEREVPVRFTAELSGPLAPVLANLAPPKLATVLENLVEHNLGARPGGVFSAFERAAARCGIARSADWRRVLRDQVAAAFRHFPSAWAEQSRSRYRAWPDKPEEQVPPTVRDAILAGHRLGIADLASQVAQHIVVQQTTADPPKLFPQRLQEIWEFEPELLSEPAVAALWRKASELLLDRSDRAPRGRVPRSFPGPALRCCEHCQKLDEFCRDPTAHQNRFKLRKDLRLHLEGEIARHGLPIRCSTVVEGSPHTLVCTKDAASYILSVNRYRADIELMKGLLGIVPAPGPPWTDDVESRLRRAVFLAS